MTPKLEIRKSKLENRCVQRHLPRKRDSRRWWIPAYAGMTCWTVFEFRISSFEFRF
jgi:hypothetical protein